MEITVNGEPRQIDDGMTAQHLVDTLQLAGKRIAMEVNLEIVPRSEYAHTRLNPGDRVEIVHAIGGG